MIISAKHLNVCTVLGGAKSLLGANLGLKAAAAVEYILDDVSPPSVIGLDVSTARYVEYTFVNAFIPPLLARTIEQPIALILTCHLESDAYEIRKGLVYGARPNLPPPVEWDKLIAELGRYLVLANTRIRKREYEYLGTSETKLLRALEMMQNVEQLSAKQFSLETGLDSSDTTHVFDDLQRRRLAFEIGRDPEPDGERQFVAATRVFERGVSA
jgi:hypothetical protein